MPYGRSGCTRSYGSKIMRLYSSFCQQFLGKKCKMLGFRVYKKSQSILVAHVYLPRKWYREREKNQFGRHTWMFPYRDSWRKTKNYMQENLQLIAKSSVESSKKWYGPHHFSLLHGRVITRRTKKRSEDLVWKAVLTLNLFRDWTYFHETSVLCMWSAKLFRKLTYE